MKKLFFAVLFLTTTSTANAGISALAEAQISNINVELSGEYFIYNPFKNDGIPDGGKDWTEYSEGKFVADIENKYVSAMAVDQWDFSYAQHQRTNDWFYFETDGVLKLSWDFKLRTKTTEAESYGAIAFSSALLGYFQNEKIDGETWWFGGYEIAIIDGFASPFNSIDEYFDGSFALEIPYKAGQWGSWFFDISAYTITGGEIIEYPYEDECETQPVPEPLSLLLFGTGALVVTRKGKSHVCTKS